jgi:hypothetical protein
MSKHIFKQRNWFSQFNYLRTPRDEQIRTNAQVWKR